MDYSKIPDILRRAGKIVRSAHDIDDSVRQKSSFRDLVTGYDTQVQELLRRELKQLAPDAGFFGEEEAKHDIAGKRVRFIVDPIDGTANFVRGLLNHLHRSR